MDSNFLNEVVDFNTPYKVSMPVSGKYVVLGEKMEEIEEIKCLGTVLCKHGGIGVRERAVKGKVVSGSLASDVSKDDFHEHGFPMKPCLTISF